LVAARNNVRQRRAQRAQEMAHGVGRGEQVKLLRRRLRVAFKVWSGSGVHGDVTRREIIHLGKAKFQQKRLMNTQTRQLCTLSARGIYSGTQPKTAKQRLIWRQADGTFSR
jgi:hypothetical protein